MTKTLVGRRRYRGWRIRVYVLANGNYETEGSKPGDRDHTYGTWFTYSTEKKALAETRKAIDREMRGKKCSKKSEVGSRARP